MESVIALVALAAIVGVGWWINEGSKRISALPASLPPMNALTGDDLEAKWIEVKRAIVTTDVYKDEARYSSLYNQASTLLLEVFSKHRAALDPSDVAAEIRRFIQVGPNTGLVSIGHGVDSEDVSDEQRLAVAMYGYLGYAPGSASHLSMNQHQCRAMVDGLIERQVSPALLLKGLMLKYGLELSQTPSPNLAARYLRAASDHGVPGAEMELRNLPRHSALGELVPANTFTDSDQWA